MCSIIKCLSHILSLYKDSLQRGSDSTERLLHRLNHVAPENVRPNSNAHCSENSRKIPILPCSWHSGKFLLRALPILWLKRLNPYLLNEWMMFSHLKFCYFLNKFRAIERTAVLYHRREEEWKREWEKPKREKERDKKEGEKEKEKEKERLGREGEKWKERKNRRKSWEERESERIFKHTTNNV